MSEQKKDVVDFSRYPVITIPLANPKGEIVRCDGKVPFLTITKVDRDRGIITFTGGRK